MTLSPWDCPKPKILTRSKHDTTRIGSSLCQPDPMDSVRPGLSPRHVMLVQPHTDEADS